MPAYNFHRQFADDVRCGRKRQTVRRKRKRPTRPGDRLYLYTGQRTKHCQLLCSPFCKEVIPLDIYQDRLVLDGRELNAGERDAFARADGFAVFAAFLAWFVKRYTLPLVGEMEVIKWD